MPADETTRRRRAPEIWRDGRAVLRPLVRNGRGWLAGLAFFLAVMLVLWLVVQPYDNGWLAWIRGDKRYLVAANRISNWGEFHILNLGFSAAFWLFGKFLRNRYLRRLAVASLLSGAVAGLCCDVLHVTCGRPRPRARLRYANLPDRFTGPNHNSDFQSFASAHTSSCFGSATPWLISMPAIGIPATLVAGTVGWSRMYGNHHYPTDVLAGMLIGVLAGLPSGLHMRRVKRRAAMKGKGPR